MATWAGFERVSERPEGQELFERSLNTVAADVALEESPDLFSG